MATDNPIHPCESCGRAAHDNGTSGCVNVLLGEIKDLRRWLSERADSYNRDAGRLAEMGDKTMAAAYRSIARALSAAYDKSGAYRPNEPTHVERSLGVRCVPLCGTSAAYGKSDEAWKHEHNCPVAQAHWLERGR